MANPARHKLSVLQQIGLVTGDLGAPAGHEFLVLAGKDDGPSASTHGPERRKQDRPVCDCDDD